MPLSRYASYAWLIFYTLAHHKNHLMYIRSIFCISAILLLAACNKSVGPTNFTCHVNGSVFQGTASTLFNPTTGTFQVIMNGANNEAVALNWYYIDSLSGTKTLTDRTYNIPTLPPCTLEGAFAAPYGSGTYSTCGTNLGGSVTITNNTGPGGEMSGTFSFHARNTSYYDTVFVSQGSFTNVPIAAN
jgi:hypothetical protein